MLNALCQQNKGQSCNHKNCIRESCGGCPNKMCRAMGRLMGKYRLIPKDADPENVDSEGSEEDFIRGFILPAKETGSSRTRYALPGHLSGGADGGVRFMSAECPLLRAPDEGDIIEIGAKRYQIIGRVSEGIWLVIRNP